MNLTELRLLAEEAKAIPNQEWQQPLTEFLAACSPERIIALVRVAEAARDVFLDFDGDGTLTIAYEVLHKLREALRDLEATP